MLFRLLKMTNWIALEIEDLEDDLENIKVFAEEGTIVAITDDLETFCDEMGVNMDHIQIVED